MYINMYTHVYKHKLYTTINNEKPAHYYNYERKGKSQNGEF